MPKSPRSGPGGRQQRASISRSALAERTGAALLLAAGFARRFGSDKRAYVLDDGRPMLMVTVETYARVFDRVMVVLRPEDEELAKRLRDCDVVYADQAHLGMGHSLSAGIRALPPVDFVFVGLADMPFVKPQTLELLVAAMQGLDAEAIVQPCYLGERGHPVGFGRAHFAALMESAGDVGARALLATEQARVHTLDVDDAGVVRDVDVPP